MLRMVSRISSILAEATTFSLRAASVTKNLWICRQGSWMVVVVRGWGGVGGRVGITFFVICFLGSGCQATAWRRAGPAGGDSPSCRS